ncbi:MAG TPA: WG repeat-containing protein [Bacteroidia bacterium]|jgi:hypothetical protein|nr:WG repeat-containing protein [Bacteroidia bacterium]
MKKTFLSFLSLLVFAGVAYSQIPAKGEVWLSPACKPKLFGLNDASGAMLLKPQYTFLSGQEDDAWIAAKGNLYGVVNSKGEWKINADYIGIYQYSKGKAVAAKKVPAPRNAYDYYSDYSSTNDSVISYGIIDETGVWLIEPKYNFLQLCDDGSVLYTDENGKFGFLNLDGSVLIVARFLWSSRMSDGVAVVAEQSMDQTTAFNPYSYSYNYTNDQFPGSYFLIDKSGHEINADPYQVIRQFFSTRAAFNKGGIWKKERYSDAEKLVGGKWGYLDASGREVIPAIYDYVYDFQNTVAGPKAKVRVGNKVMWIDANGTETGPSELAAITTPQVYCEPGSFGYLDMKGNWAIQPQFKVANNFSEGLASVMKLHAKDQECGEEENTSSYNYYDDYVGNSYTTFNPLTIFRQGIPVKSDDVDVLAQQRQDSINYAESQKRRLYGYIDMNGNMLLDAKYEAALEFHNGRAFVKFRGSWGVIDKKGNWIMPPVLDNPDGLYSDGDYEGSYDYYGSNYGSSVSYASEISYEANAEYYMHFNEGMAMFFKYGKYGFMDTTGKIIVSPVYASAMDFQNGLAAVCNNSKWGFIDKTGKEVIPIRFTSVSSFNKDGLSVCGIYANKEDMGPPEDGMEYEQDETFYGFLGKNGKWVLSPRFTALGDLCDGLAYASEEYGSTGYVDKSGKFVIPQKYSYGYNFDNGFALVRMSMHQPVYIDKTGKQSKTYTQDNPPPSKDQFMVINTSPEGNYGAKDMKGNIIIPFEYEYLGIFTKAN